MAEQHRATDSEWYCLETRTCGDKSDVPAYSCILELRDRIEALEARGEDDKEAWAARLRRPGRSQAERIASLAERITSLQKRIDALEVAHRGQPNHEELPDSSLVHRVARAMNGATEWQARAAIREVADWMRENPDVHFPPALVFVLEKEAER